MPTPMPSCSPIRIWASGPRRSLPPDRRLPCTPGLGVRVRPFSRRRRAGFRRYLGPPEPAGRISGRPDIAAGLGAQGVQLAHDDVSPADARRVLAQGWIGRSVHSPEEAAIAVQEGTDFLVVGSICPTASHPGQAAAGPELLRQVIGL